MNRKPFSGFSTVNDWSLLFTGASNPPLSCHLMCLSLGTSQQEFSGDKRLKGLMWGGQSWGPQSIGSLSILGVPALSM